MGEFLLPNYYVYVNVHEKFYKITGTEPFEYRTGQEAIAHFSSVAAAGESGWINITTLEPDDAPRHLFQVRMGVKYNMRYYFKIPTGTNRFGIDDDKDIGFVDEDISPYDDPNEDFEFWLVKEYYPAINAKNDSLVRLTPKVYFTGMKYDIAEVKEHDVLARLKNGLIPFKTVTVGGVRT